MAFGFFNTQGAEGGSEGDRKALRAIDFLSQAYMLDQQIQTKMHQLSSLRSLSESMHSFRAGDPVSHTKNVTMLEDAVIKIMEEEQELNAGDPGCDRGGAGSESPADPGKTASVL